MLQSYTLLSAGTRPTSGDTDTETLQVYFVLGFSLSSFKKASSKLWSPYSWPQNVPECPIAWVQMHTPWQSVSFSGKVSGEWQLPSGAYWVTGKSWPPTVGIE